MRLQRKLVIVELEFLQRERIDRIGLQPGEQAGAQSGVNAPVRDFHFSTDASPKCNPFSVHEGDCGLFWNIF